MRYVCLLISMSLFTSVLASAQEGAAIYKERCASCHDAPQGRTPALSVIKQMTGEAVYLALTAGAMKEQASGLSITQLFSLIGYIAPTGGRSTKLSFEKTCTANVPTTTSAAAWGGWSPSVTNSRFRVPAPQA